MIKQKIFITYLFLSVFIFFQNAFGDEQLLDAVLVTINNTPITLSDINKKYSKTFSVSDFRYNDTAKKLLDSVILDTVVALEAKKKRFSVSEDEIGKYISEIARRNSLSVPAFKEELKKQNISFTAYREQVKSDILKSKIASSIIRNGAAVSEKEIDNYLKNIQESKLRNSKISLNQICILKEGKSEANALAILKKVKDALSDEDFSTVAKEYSETPDAKNGGNIGEFELNELSTEIFQAISGLGNNEISKIVTGENAYYIFQVQNKKNQEEATSQERELAKEKLEEEHLKDAINDYFSKEIYKNYSIEKK